MNALQQVPAMADLIRSGLLAIFAKGQVVELRVPKAGRDGTIAGFFNNSRALAAAAAELSGKYPGVYVTLNPVNPELFDRAPNRVVTNAERGILAHDKDIIGRRWLPIDFDPVRPADCASTDEEHAAALERAQQARDYLTAKGWPQPIFANSGNGAHLLYRIELANDDEAKAAVRGVLAHLKEKFSDDAVKSDTTVSNAARIWKVYGTMSAKGENTQERPHRLAEIIDKPQELGVVTLAQLQELAPPEPERNTAPAQQAPKNTGHNKYAITALDSACRTIQSAVPGTRNQTLNDECFGIAQLVAAGHLAHGLAFGLLESAALQSGLDKEEIKATMASAFKAGMENPRDPPPRPERRQRMPVQVPPPEAPSNIDPETGEVMDYDPANDNTPMADAEPLGPLTSWLLTHTRLKVIGRDENDGVWLVPPGTRDPVCYKMTQLLRKAELISIMPAKDWEGLIIQAGEGDRFKAELAASAVMQAARENPMYRLPEAPRREVPEDMLTGVQGRDSAIIARKLEDLTLFDVPTQAWWRWNTVWRRIDDELIRKVLVSEADKHLGEDYENSYINGTLALLRSRLARLPEVGGSGTSEIWENDRNLLPMRNGVLDLEAGDLRPHSPDFMFNWVVPHNYDPEAECPVTERFIQNLSGGDPSTEWVLWCFMAAVLHGRSDLQRYLEFVGMAGTGKSTFITLCKELVGEENVHSTDMRTLHNSQFETANIYGKRLTVISDADKYGGDVGVFKSLTGEDIVRREEKNKQAQKSFVYRGMVIVAANNPIQFSDTSTAMARRRIPVHIDKKLDKSAVDFRLQQKLRDELPGLINRLLDISHEKVTEVLTDTEGHRRNAANRALVETNAIAAWANECLVVDTLQSSKVGKLGAEADVLLYPNYARFCEQTGRRGVVALNTFTRSLTDVLATVGVDVQVKHKNTGTHIEGIRLRTAPWDDEVPRLMINM